MRIEFRGGGERDRLHEIYTCVDSPFLLVLFIEQEHEQLDTRYLKKKSGESKSGKSGSSMRYRQLKSKSKSSKSGKNSSMRYIRG